jgi:hypothetical protein
MSIAGRFLCDRLVSVYDLIETCRPAKMKRSDAWDERGASIRRDLHPAQPSHAFGGWHPF